MKTPNFILYSDLYIQSHSGQKLHFYLKGNLSE